MARHEFYCQCYMERKSKRTPCGRETLVSWIPSTIARVGNVVKLRNSADEPWSEHWRVIEVWAKKRGEQVEDASRDHLHQRGESDV